MANDPGLAADTCTFMEAVSGDGGAHNTGGVWWLSPDIQLIGSVSGPDKADPGVDNTVDVTLHVPANCALVPGTESLTMELFVANPSLAMAPNNAASTTKIDSFGVAPQAGGGSQTHQFLWVPPTGLPAADPQSPGHKCLIARCYADLLTPSATNFFVPGDRHVAQHNICIVPCGGPGAVTRPAAGCGLDVTTINPDVKKAQKTTLRATLDLEPDKYVRDVVLRRLKKTTGFSRLATAPPRGFQLEVARFPKAKVVDRTKTKAKAKSAALFETVITLEPAQLVALRFTADLRGAKLGEAYIFHLTQHGPDAEPQGGLTAVMMAI